jgi:hypothetical protein
VKKKLGSLRRDGRLVVMVDVLADAARGRRCAAHGAHAHADSECAEEDEHDAAPWAKVFFECVHAGLCGVGSDVDDGIGRNDYGWVCGLATGCYGEPTDKHGE